MTLHLKLEDSIKGIFVTTIKLSDFARNCANALNIEVKENFEFDKGYPRIKCNISHRDGEKIYHLPFDQQYNRVMISTKEGELYANTIEEAEDKGFRRAERHYVFE